MLLMQAFWRICLNPPQNAFAERLGADPQFNFFKLLAPDQMHEGEIGIVKAVIQHIVRILDSHNPELVHELDRR